MSNNIQIKECKSDAEKRKVWTLFFQNYPGDSHGIENVESYIEKVCNFACIIAAYADEQIVGFAAFYANDLQSKVAYITQILVSEQCRGLRVGKKLVKACEMQCQEKGFEVLKLEVHKDNENAIGFYKHYGFTKEEEQENSFYMVRKL